jgi:hypothetical protein
MAKQKKSIPEGSIRIHLYNYRNVLKPRGSMQKESLGLEIHECLTSAFEEWANPNYGDNPSRSDLLSQLRKNLLSEVEAAWTKFIGDR